MRIRALLTLGLIMAATCGDPTSPASCDTGAAYTLGSVVEGTFASGDCEDGDIYDFTLTTQQVVKFQITGSKGIIRLLSHATNPPDGSVIAVEGGSTPNPTTFHVVLPPGSYSAEVYSETAVIGPYTLTSTVLTPPEPAGCVTAAPNRRFFLLRGANVAGALATGDCNTGGVDNRTFDTFHINMVSGKSYKFTITASMGLLVTVDKNGVELTRQSQTGAGTTVVTYVATSTGVSIINLLGTPSGTLGTYTIKLE